MADHNHDSDHDDTKDPLFSNKVAAAVLAVALIFFGLPQIIDVLTGSGGHGGGHHGDDHATDPENPLGLAYPIAFQMEGSPKVEKVKVDLGTLLAEASADAGKRSSAVCASCHTFEKGGATGTGPNLWNIVERPLGAISGFKYSASVANAGGTWTYEALDAYLKNSQAYMPGTQMAQKISKDKKRANILAYLQTLADTPTPFPAPVVPEVVEEIAENLSLEGADDSALMSITDNVTSHGEAHLNAAGEMMEKATDVAQDHMEHAEEIIEGH